MDKQLLYEILKLSECGKRYFGDKDLILHLGKKENISTFLSNNKKILDTITINLDVCPSCKKQLLNTKNGFCGGCGSNFSNDKITHHKISIDKKGYVELIKDHLKKTLNGWDLKRNELNFIFFQKGISFIAIFISLEPCGLIDYYTLKGWLEKSDDTVFVLISPSFDKELEVYSIKNEQINILSYKAILCEESLFLNKIEHSLATITEEKKFAEVEGGVFEEELNLLELKDRINATLSNLDSFALHKNKLSPQENGRKYQKAIVEILNQTIFPIKVLVKQDIQDVFVRVPANSTKTSQKIRWVPIEIKSYGITPKNQGKFSLRDYCSQYKKYIEGYINNPAVSAVIDVECFGIIAKDFLMDKDNKDALEELEKSFDNKIHIILIPQNTLIYLVNKRLDQKNPLIDWDFIVDLFRKNEYLTNKEIDEFYNKIDEYFLKSPEETAIKNVQEKVHKIGK